MAVVEAAKERVEVVAAAKVRPMQVVVVAMDMVKVAAKLKGGASCGSEGSATAAHQRRIRRSAA